MLQLFYRFNYGSWSSFRMVVSDLYLGRSEALMDSAEMPTNARVVRALNGGSVLESLAHKSSHFYAPQSPSWNVRMLESNQCRPIVVVRSCRCQWTILVSMWSLVCPKFERWNTIIAFENAFYFVHTLILGFWDDHYTWIYGTRCWRYTFFATWMKISLFLSTHRSDR